MLNTLSIYQTIKQSISPRRELFHCIKLPFHFLCKDESLFSCATVDQSQQSGYYIGYTCGRDTKKCIVGDFVFLGHQEILTPKHICESQWAVNVNIAAFVNW